jgi:hypothetical protein
MRDLTKSMMSYGWAMSVFGVQQMVNLMFPSTDAWGKATKSFNDVTQATADTLDSTLKATFRVGDNVQSGLVDMMFGGFMSAGLDPSRWARMGSEAAQQMGDLGRQAAQAAAGFTQGAGGPMASGGTAASAGGPAGPSTPTSSGWGPMPH